MSTSRIHSATSHDHFLGRKADTTQGLNGPYDAKAVGDFTGLTPPLRAEREDDD